MQAVEASLSRVERASCHFEVDPSCTQGDARALAAQHLRQYCRDVQHRSTFDKAAQKSMPFNADLPFPPSSAPLMAFDNSASSSPVYPALPRLDDLKVADPVAYLMRTVGDLSGQITTLLNSNNTMSGQIITLSTSNTTFSDEIATLTQSNTTMSGEIATLTESNTTMRGEIASLTTSNDVVCRAYCRRELPVVVGLAGARICKGGAAETGGTGKTGIFDYAQSVPGRMELRKLAKEAGINNWQAPAVTDAYARTLDSNWDERIGLTHDTTNDVLQSAAQALLDAGLAKYYAPTDVRRMTVEALARNVAACF